MSTTGAMLAHVVREAIGQVAAPDVAKKILAAAMQRYGCDELPGDPISLARLVDGPLCEVLIDYLGEDVAEAVRADLEPIIAQAEASSGVHASAAEPIPAAPDALEIDLSPPAPQSSKADRRETPQPTSNQRSKPKTVVVADPDAAMLEATVQALQAEGFEVLSAADGYTALELIQTVHPDVVVADLHMPAVGGKQLIQALERTMENAPPVIITTANVFAPSAVPGAAEVMRKPFDMDELVTAIELAVWDHASGIG